KATGLACDYKKAINRDSFVIMRHDVEYSVERAYRLSKVEERLDFVSSYFFQWTNNSYNLLSKKNMDMIKDMHERGQHIGLHFALNGMTDMELIRSRIKQEIDMLSDMLGFKITSFSIHRPSPDVLAENIKLPGIINAYQDEFFSFDPNAKPDSVLPIKYMSDANHIWRYGYPDEETIKAHKKVQILTHPFAWTKKGYDNLENYKTLVNEKYVELIDSIDNECKDFGPLRDNFEKLPVEL
ncbi:MAG: hypothetical protein IKZ97_07810, partial [Butyrivibrio sp.]|nr:hypothetical protein [Butyrivibrio sp.]